MSKIIRLTESDLNKIVRRVIKEQSLKENKLMTEQKWLKNLFGTSVDDLIKLFGDDAVKSFETVLSKALQNSKNFVSKAGQNYLKSASGAEISMETIKQATKLVSSGAKSADEIATLLPRQLADGSEFREVFKNSFSKKVTQNTSSGAAKVLGAFERKFLLKNCNSSSYCDVKSILNNFYSKLGNSSKLTKFNPSKVKILSKSNVAGREVVEVSLEDGTNVLFYKSSGQNVATTGKQAGEWFVIPGFAENGWFFKTQETINLTKGGNKYLTDFAEFLEINGLNLLGK
jgi:hypothetical protein